MLFNSYEYLLFLPLVTLVYWLLPGKARSVWLFAASYFFYACWNYAYLGLIAFSTLSTWLCGLALERLTGAGWRKAVVALNLTLNFLILFLFKYYNLFADTVGLLGVALPRLKWLLPVGISFYTFQALGYTLDVYRGERAERNLLYYALFISFFPQLVAGPIESARNLLPQLKDTQRRFCFASFRKGLLLLLWGFFLKSVVADGAARVVDAIYGMESPTGFQYLVATLCFSIQIYGDFAGYSTIAVGSAQLLGIRLIRNFRQPYFSRSISEFWQRWHISLNNWFREYLYFPLGGSRRGTARTCLNLLIVFLVSGLWHGANWTFVLWGLLNGLYQVGERFLHPRERRNPLWIAAVFALVTLSWVPFRAQSLSEAVRIYQTMFSASLIPGREIIGQTYKTFGIQKPQVIALAASIGLMLLVDVLESRKPGLCERVEARGKAVRWPIYYGLMLLILIFGVYGSMQGAESFLYFQF